MLRKAVRHYSWSDAARAKGVVDGRRTTAQILADHVALTKALTFARSYSKGHLVGAAPRPLGSDEMPACMLPNGRTISSHVRLFQRPMDFGARKRIGR